MKKAEKVETKKPVEKAVDKKAEDAPKPKVPKADPKPAPTEVQVMAGTYKLSALMVTLGFPAFAHDAARLFEKGVVSVDGEMVCADADYEVGSIVIAKDEQEFHVVGMVLTVPK